MWRQNKAAKKSVSFSCERQMVPSLLQLVRRGCGHLDAVSRSCEILQSPQPCEDSTVPCHREVHLLRTTPPEEPHRHSSPSAAPSLHPATEPLSEMSSVSNGRRIYPSFNWLMNSHHRDAMNEWTHLHCCSSAAESTDMSPVSDFVRDLFVLGHGGRVHWVAC